MGCCLESFRRIGLKLKLKQYVPDLKRLVEAYKIIRPMLCAVGHRECEMIMKSNANHKNQKGKRRLKINTLKNIKLV